MEQKDSRVLRKLLVVVALLGWAGAQPAPAEAPETLDLLSSRSLFSGHGYGTHAFVGELILAGKTAPVGLGCGGAGGENEVVGVDAAPILEAASVVSTAEGRIEGLAHIAEVANEVEGVSLLNGVITADLIRAVSTTRRVGSLFEVSDEGTEFVDLRILGIPVIGEVEPNTRLDLLGFGYVTLNEQVASVTGSSSYLSINMIHVVIEVPNPLVDVGTEIVVSSALSKLRAGAGFLGGAAFGTKVDILGTVSTGQLAKKVLPCSGTNGHVQQTALAEVNLWPAVVLGELVSTVQGSVGQTSVAAETTNTISGIDVLDGLITADVIQAKAQVWKSGQQVLLGTEGSSFVNLRVAGFPAIDDNVAPNTHLTIPGIGSLWLKRIVQHQDRITIRMIELTILEDNPLDLPIGSKVQVSSAYVAAH